MLGFARAPKTAPQTRQAHPRLETLEDRWMPAIVSITNVTYGINRMITLTGTLTDTQTPANQTIQISGVVDGMATTNAEGEWSISMEASGLGTVTASLGAASGSWTLTDEAPVLTAFSGSEGENDLWTFSGTVTYNRAFEMIQINMGGTPVTFAVGQTGGTDETGAFFVNITLTGDVTDNGTVWAKAVSAFGFESNTRTFVIHQSGT